MTKRRNPFDDCPPPLQLKTHVNEKHVASKEDMQEIYKTTWARMKEGSRQAFSNGTANGFSVYNGTENGYGVNNITSNGYGASNGTLNGYEASGSGPPLHHCNKAGVTGPLTGSTTMHVGGTVKKNRCRCCKALVEGRRHMVCGYCQQPACVDSCTNKCDVCENYFCLFCTVLNYDRPETRSFCSDCLQHFTWQ